MCAPNKLIFIMFVMLIINSVYGDPSGGHSGGSKKQTDLVLVGSCNKSSGIDGDNITIQYVLSNIGTEKSQDAWNIKIPINIPGFFARPSGKLQVSNDWQVCADPHNPCIVLNTSKVKETSNYKLVLDTNGCLIIDCPRLNPNNSIKISYLTYVDYSGNENTDSISSGTMREDFDNVREGGYKVYPIVFSPLSRPIEVNTTDMFADGNKYYILNNSEITIDYHLLNGKSKNVSYIYRTKNENKFHELTSENRIDRAGEFNFGIKLEGEAPRYNQSIFVVEDLATYHNIYVSVIYLIIVLISLTFYSQMLRMLSIDKRPKQTKEVIIAFVIQVIMICILLGLQWSVVKYLLIGYLSWMHYSDVILWQLGISLISYVILINLSILIDSLNSVCGNNKIIVGISLVSAIIYLFLPDIITSHSSILELIGSVYGKPELSFQIIILLLLVIIIFWIYRCMVIKYFQSDFQEKILFGIASSAIVLCCLACLKNSFEYPISHETLVLITAPAIIVTGLLFMDRKNLFDPFARACQISKFGNFLHTDESNDSKVKASLSNESGNGKAPPHEDKKE